MLANANPAYPTSTITKITMYLNFIPCQGATSLKGPTIANVTLTPWLSVRA